MHSGEALEKEQAEIAAGEDVQVRSLLQFCAPGVGLLWRECWADKCRQRRMPGRLLPCADLKTRQPTSPPTHSPPPLPLCPHRAQVLNAQDLVALMAPSAVGNTNGNGNGTSRKSLVVNYGL